MGNKLERSGHSDEYVYPHSERYLYDDVIANPGLFQLARPKQRRIDYDNHVLADRDLKCEMRFGFSRRDRVKFMVLRARKQKDEGFSLVECVVAMTLVMVGFTGICGLLTSCVKAELLSSNLAMANSLARSKVEELKVATRTAGGSLTTNTTGYYDTPTANFTRRWTVTSSVASTQLVTVAVVQTNQSDAMPQVQVTTRMQ